MTIRDLGASVGVLVVIGSLLAFASVIPVQGRELQPGELNVSQEKAQAVLLLVEDGVLSQLGTAYAEFKADLVHEGFTVLQDAVAASTQPPEIKAIIQGYWSDPAYALEGTILIGDLKAPYFISKTGDFSDPEALEVWLSLDPTDMYYEDLDGSWDHLTVEEFHDIVANPPPEVVELYQYPSCSTFENEYLVSFDKEKEWDYQYTLSMGRVRGDCVSRLFGV